MVDAAHAHGIEDKTPPVTVPPVISAGQQNGVTAGYVAHLTQVLPSLVTGPQLEQLKALFVDGARLRRDFENPGSDQNIDILCARADFWANRTFVWLNSNVSAYAAERFIFRPPTLSFSYTIRGEHAAGYADKWGETRDGLAALLINLDQLMRDPSIYPQ